MKKILILGTGNAQVDFIDFCKANKFITHACSYKKEGRGVDSCDYFHLANITDPNTISQIVNEHNIDILYSVGSDLAMPTISEVSTNLNKNCFIDKNCAEICNNKPKLRESLNNLKNGIYSIKHAVLLNEQDIIDWSIFPAIVKPSKSQGQRGINKINNYEELKSAIVLAKNTSQDGIAIIEEYVDGFEISANSYMLDSKPMFYFITERISFSEYPGGIIKSHRYPVSGPFNQKKIEELINDSCSHLNIKNGPVYFQIKINSNGVPKIIEITPRLDGCHLWRMLKVLGGPDLYSIIIKHLTRDSVTPSDFSMSKFISDCKSELQFFTQLPNSLMNKELHGFSKNALHQEWYYENNEVIRTINGYQEKVGYEITINYV